MKLKTLQSVEVKDKTILYRAPYDIDVKVVSGGLEVADDLRIKATIPTLEYLIKENCKIVILTYVKRPNGQVVENLRTTPHAKKLSELLKRPVFKVDDCVGREVEEKIKNLKGGEILMLENVRFHKEEMVDDDEFSKELCKNKDLIVFDGFPQAHRKHSSTTGIERHLPAVSGMYLEKEVNMLSSLLENPKHPFTLIIGGAKISDKVDSVNNLLPLADNILVAGAVANVFLKAKGNDLADSFIEDVFVDEQRREKKDWVEYAIEIMDSAHSLNKKFVTPMDLIISDGNSIKILDIRNESVPVGWRAMDIGPETRKNYAEIIKNSKTVFINGPAGKFEDPRFAEGSKAILQAMKETQGETMIAGGDTIDMARIFGNLNDYSHTSLAGGATLEFLAGKELPALAALKA